MPISLAKLDYSDVMEQIKQQYGPKAMALLERIKDAFELEGYTVNGPYDMCSDDYRWSMLVTAPGMPQENGMDIAVEIAEERDYDGGEGWGINFGVDIVRYGGRIVGGMQPFNYTDEVWVDARDAEAVETRWSYLENADSAAAVQLVVGDFDQYDN